MMNTTAKLLCTTACLMAGCLWAQDGPRGHWTGTVEIPDQALAVEIDLDKNTTGWIGSISIPAQNASGLPLEAIAVTDAKVTFRIKGIPGEPTFSGALAKDGKTISGEFAQGGGSFPFTLKRTGDPKVEMEKSSPPVAKEFLGTWEGTLDAGQQLRLVVKISNDERGAKAVMLSLDQGGGEIPVSAIEQKDAKLTLIVKAVGGEYSAEINKDQTELNGTWTQSGNSLPLKLKKAAKP